MSANPMPSRHNAQLRAAASAYENAEPEGELDERLWQDAVMAEAEAQAADDCAAIDLLADPSAEAALYKAARLAAVNNSFTFCDVAQLNALLATAKATQAAVQSRYDELIANGGRP